MSFFGPYGGAEERGAGGKLRRPPTRKPPATPYARPLAVQAQRGQRRWLSKIVDPAYQMIAGGATLLFPYFFSKVTTVGALPSTTEESQVKHLQRTDIGLSSRNESEDASCVKLEENASGGNFNTTSNHGIPRITGEASPSSEAHPSSDAGPSMVSAPKRAENEEGELVYKDGFPEIEQLLKGRNFSRDEVYHLLEIISSRAVELPSEEEIKKASMTAGEEPEGPPVSHDNPKTFFEKNTEASNGAPWETSTPVTKSFMPDEIGASPIEIARAYMGSRASEIGMSSKSMTLKDENSFLQVANFTLKPAIPSPCSKQSACWPGVMVKDERDYLTPQSQRGRSGLHSFPRTPYSRTIFSKSKSKLTQLHGDNDKWLPPSSSSLKQSQTPIFGQVKSRSDMDDSYGSVGPIRRSRHKLVAGTPKGSSVIGSLSIGPSKFDDSNVSNGLLSTVRKKFEPVTTNSTFQTANNTFQFLPKDRKQESFNAGVPTVHPQSSQIARTILEHIDRNPVTPKDRSEEIKLAIARKKPMSSNCTPSNNSNENNSLLHVNWSDSHNGLKIFPQDNAEKQSSLFTVPLRDKTLGSKIRSSNDDDRGSQMKRLEEDVKTGCSEVPNLQTKSLFQSSGSRPVLPSISVDKPASKWIVSSDNNTGFTFPVSTSSGVLSEPPTPSIFPSFSGSSQNHAKDGTEIPSYSFGSKKRGPPLVFSFPSTSNAAIHDDTPDIKFSFGSDEARLSFASLRRDVIST